MFERERERERERDAQRWKQEAKIIVSGSMCRLWLARLLSEVRRGWRRERIGEDRKKGREKEELDGRGDCTQLSCIGTLSICTLLTACSSLPLAHSWSLLLSGGG